MTVLSLGTGTIDDEICIARRGWSSCRLQASELVGEPASGFGSGVTLAELKVLSAPADCSNSVSIKTLDQPAFIRAPI